MPLPPPPKDLLAQIKAKKQNEPDSSNDVAKPDTSALMAAIQNKQRASSAHSTTTSINHTTAATTVSPRSNTSDIPKGKLFTFDKETSSFIFDLTSPAAIAARLAPDTNGNSEADIVVPLAPCVYRMTDYTYNKKEPILLERSVNKLGVLRCLAKECTVLNSLIWERINPSKLDMPLLDSDKSQLFGVLEDDELSKIRFMELLSSCGVYQSVSEMILKQCHTASELARTRSKKGNQNNPYLVPQIRVEGLTQFLDEIENLVPALALARAEIEETQAVSFHPGLGELFTPGSKLICYPEGMEGTPLGVSTVQSWYDEEINHATNKVKRRFILVVEFLVSVGEELVFVAASEVIPEFHDGRNVSIQDLSHRRLDLAKEGDEALMERLHKRGAFYASVATDNHYLEYHPNAFFPIIGGWGNNAARPLSKSGRVMVDVKRGSLEGHIPVRGSSDGMSDTVKGKTFIVRKAMKLFDQSKRTGVKVPFRTAILHDIRKPLTKSTNKSTEQTDTDKLWMAWPMLTGFSFTARCWGKILLSLPKATPVCKPKTSSLSDSPSRPSVTKLGVQRAALGGVGECGNVNYIRFHDKAFEQLVLADDKKELIRAVARNAGGGSNFEWDENSSDDDDEEDEIGLDVVANKGAASIFLLSGPPGCGKTLTAEAVAELLRKPLYVVTAGDLGTTAAELEKSLGGVLTLCSTWDALVLLDEADIFLEARSSTEIQRNALVCVMLRLLEYYSGCLFLSSNRDAESIDAAIASRITVMLNYPSLDLDGRAKVWKNLIELVPTIPLDDTGVALPDVVNKPRKLSKYRDNFTEEDYHLLASSFSLNGRQIKNSIVLARALARERGISLSVEILHRAVIAVAGNNATISPSILSRIPSIV